MSDTDSAFVKEIIGHWKQVPYVSISLPLTGREWKGGAVAALLLIPDEVTEER